MKPNMENIPTPVIVTIGAMIFVIIVLVFALYSSNEREQRLAKSIDRLTERYQSKGGATTMYNGTNLSYNLQSFDGGKIWYACEYGKNWELNILGKAEDVYPGLMKHLAAWDKITEYVEKHGAIGSKAITEEEKQMLRDANFTVEEKK